VTDDNEIERARQRIEMDVGSDLDHHRMRAQVRKDMRAVEVVYKDNERALVEEAREAVWNNWFDARFDTRARETVIAPVGDALGETRAELRAFTRDEVDKIQQQYDCLAKLVEEIMRVALGERNKFEQMSREVAELRGEVRAMRSATSAKLWRPGE